MKTALILPLPRSYLKEVASVRELLSGAPGKHLRRKLVQSLGDQGNKKQGGPGGAQAMLIATVDSIGRDRTMASLVTIKFLPEPNKWIFPPSGVSW